MNFHPGWYEVEFFSASHRKRCRYFKTTSVYVAECFLEPNGAQILVWQDPNGTNGAGRPAQWSESYRALPFADPGDWWDNPPGGPQYGPSTPKAFVRATRTPTVRESCQRAGSADTALVSADCVKEIHVGLFFDGTNNNMDRDKEDFSHSNVVSLFDAHKTSLTEHFRYYIPGVGTPFPKIGEMGESSDGKTFAAGGEARIHFAMLNVLNAACRASTGFDLMQESEMRGIVTNSSDGLATWWRLGDSKMLSIFDKLNKRLLQAVEGQRPRVSKINLSVYGFSRGAAEARVFAKWMQMVATGGIGTASLNINFLGLFDTVASVFLADSSPIGSGFFDWADGNLEIAGPKRTAHFVAAHEIRMSFPLSTARAGGAYPTGVKEVVYPGAHSDVGGGYGPGDQGKAKSARSLMVSQIPLNDMHFEALNAGAALTPLKEMEPESRRDFAIDGQLNAAFNAYAQWTSFDDKSDLAASGERAENRLQDHMHLYWRWRAKVSPDASFKALKSFTAAKRQDQVDLWESELDWRADVQRAQEAAKPRQMYTRAGAYTVPGDPSELQRRLLAETALAATVPADVSTFFDEYIHDSHGGFWLLGPQTKADRATFIQGIKAKKAKRDALIAAAERQESVGDFDGATSSRAAASGYELNKFEERVLKNDAVDPGNLPVMSDGDAPDLRDNAGFLAAFTVRRLVGSATRREPHGHGRYRRVFDRS